MSPFSGETMPNRSITLRILCAMAGLCVAAGAMAADPTATVVEFYNTTLRHYFMTAGPAEAAAIDAGAAGPGWVRTGGRFSAFANPADAPGTLAVCRFYGSTAVDPETGLRRGPNSHFYTSDEELESAVGAIDEILARNEWKRYTDEKLVVT